MKTGLLLLMLLASSKVGYAQTLRNSFTDTLTIIELDVQRVNAYPQGVGLFSKSTFAQQQAIGSIGLGRKNYWTTAGSDNDLIDETGIWIKGFYQNSPYGLPIYLGGYGYNSNSFTMIIDRDNNVGIGTGTPRQKLEINGTALVAGAGSGFKFDSRQSDGHDYQWYSSDGKAKLFDFNDAADRLVITATGNVGIGTANPAEKLAVEGAITARRVKVSQENWPDYVFDSAYQLPSLESVEKYVKANRHLEGIPDATTIKKENQDLGNIQRAMLEKLEEVTLYLIELKKENAALRKEIEKLKTK